MDGRGHQVVRHRLLGRLAARFERRLTTIEAGAGFGKSTLLGQAVAEAAATRRGLDVVFTVPRAGVGGRALLEALGRFGDSPTPAAPDVAAVASRVWAHAPLDVCLAIDDVQWLDAGAVDVVAALLDELPRNGHLLLSGRQLPDVPVARLVAAGEVERLDEDDLAFDTDEQAAFVARRGVPNGTSTGWPALLELECVSGHSGAVQYLVEEVIDSIEPERRTACRRLAVHPVFDDELVATVTGFDGDTDELTAGLPLTTIGPDGTGSFHELLRDALLADLAADEADDARRRVGAVLEQRRDFDAAIRLYAEAGALDGVRRIARRIAADVHLGQPSESRRRLADELRELLGDCLEVAVVTAIYEVMDDPARALPRLAAAAARARAEDDTDLEALCLLRSADLAYGAAELERLETDAERIAALAAGGSPAARRVTHLPQIWLRSLTNRHAEVVSYIEQVRRTGGGEIDDDTHQLLDFYHVINRAYVGHVAEALRDAAVLRRLPGGLFANRFAGFEWIQRWQLGEMTPDDLEEVVALLDHIEELGETHLFAEGAATSALFHASHGDLPTARSLTERAERKAHRLPSTAWAHHSVAQARAVLAVFDGDEEAAAAILHDAIPERGIASLPRFVYGATAALSYVLCPSTRAVWDADSCGPDHVLRRDIGRALVALRERADVRPAARLPWDEPARIRPWAYEPHLAELATAALVAGDRRADAVFATLRHDPHRDLTAIAARATPAVAERATEVARRIPHRAREHLAVRVLGDVELALGGRPVTDETWHRRQRVRDLLLLLVDLRSVERARVAELMWPDKPPDAGARNLRFTLNQLLSVLEPRRGATDLSWYVRSTGSRLVLAGGDQLTLDVDQFDDLLASARYADRTSAPQRALDGYRRACALYRGDYLSGASDREWGYYDALRLRGEFVTAAARASDLLVTAGEADEAEALALRAAEAEPDNEVGAQALAAALIARGRIGAAREVLGALLAELHRSGLAADERTSRLAQRLGLEPRPVGHG